LAERSVPHLFPQKCLDVSDVAEYLGKRYGGWVAGAIAYGKGKGGKWIDLPICWSSNVINYRKSSLRQAGFSKAHRSTPKLSGSASMTTSGNPSDLMAERWC
jgi:multiple sugar transport system substrate-binding protein